jgi:GlcNAc-P-P-Und epimerase
VDQKPVAVIGGSGFVGRHVLALLASRGIAAINIDRVAAPDLAVETRIADLRDAAGMTAALKGCGTAIFLAAEWRDDVRPISLYYDVNVGGAANFVTAAKANAITTCIFTSSVSVYGPTTYEVDEDYTPNPINDYGQSKLEGEAVLKAWQAEDRDVSLTIIRPTVIFGPGNRGNVWNLLNQIANGPFLMIGDGTNRKSVAYVENVAAFIAQQMTAQPGLYTYNYADKPDFDMNAFVSMIYQEMGKPAAKSRRFPKSLAMAAATIFDVAGRITGKKFAITKERVFKFCANTQYSSAKAMGSGYIPPVDLETALRKTIQIEFVK